MNRKIFIVLYLVILSTINAQFIEVVETKLIEFSNDGDAFYPKFSKDDKNIVFSSSSYKGLNSYSLESGEIVNITQKLGAGYNPIITDDKILFRSYEIKSGKKLHSIYSINLKDRTQELLVEKKRNLKLPLQNLNANLIYIEKSIPNFITGVDKILEKDNLANKAVFVEDNNLYLAAESKTLINPLGKGVYVWESISNDGKNLLFTFGNKGTFLTDLDGNILTNIKEAHYPRFSPNGRYISYMLDKDNGHNYISSDIYVYSIEQDKSVQITNTEAKIEMYPEWSNSGDNLVFNTTKGEIYISKLLIEN